MNRIIMHVDMDAFFVSVEVRDKPHLKGKPIAVSGDISERSVIATASYEARKCGVHSAMPVFKALILCPNLIILKANHKKYEAVSREIIKTLYLYSPAVETFSIDEAFIDLTYRVKNFSKAKILGKEIKNRIVKKFDLPLTVGISSNKLLAKLASKLGKPDGMKVILPEDATSFLTNIPAGRISGIGPKTAEILREKFSVNTLGELRKIPLLTLYSAFKSNAIFLYNAARGIDKTPVMPDYEKKGPKSIGNSETLPFNTKDQSYLLNVLKYLANTVTERLKESKLYARTIILVVRFADFQTITKRTKVRPTNSRKIIFLTSTSLLKEIEKGKKIRLLGITATDLTSSPAITLFDSPDEKVKRIEETIYALKVKYGKYIVNYASVFDVKHDWDKTI